MSSPRYVRFGGGRGSGGERAVRSAECVETSGGEIKPLALAHARAQGFESCRHRRYCRRLVEARRRLSARVGRFISSARANFGQLK